MEARADRGPGPALADRDLDLATAGTTAAQLHKVRRAILGERA